MDRTQAHDDRFDGMENPGASRHVPPETASPMPVLEARDLSVSLAGREILHALTFDLDAGRWIGVIGPNGSGKTTLLRSIGGLLPYSGHLALDGIPLAAWSPKDLARRVAFVRQSFGLGFDFTVEELVLLGRSPHKNWLVSYDRQDHDLARAALSSVDLEGFESRSMLALSGGEQRRVLLAQALVQGAGVLLLDEPTTFLDVHHRYEFLHHVRGLADRGTTVVGVFHELETAVRYTDAVLVLHEGRIQAYGKPGDVLTPDLVARVFRMESRSGFDDDGRPEIRFVAPIPRSRTIL